MMNDNIALCATIEQLQHDSRPSFVIDPTTYETSRAPHTPATQCNPALTAFPDVLAAVSRPHHEIVLDTKTVKFRYWISRSLVKNSATTRQSCDVYDFLNIFWTVLPLNATHVIVSGLPKAAIAAAIDNVDIVDTVSSTVKLGTRLSPLLDETDTGAFNPATLFGKNCIEQQPYIDLFHSIDWAKTSLGPLDQWSVELRVMSHLVLVDPQPSFLFLGEELYVVHNAAGATFLPDAQGLFMGSTPEKVFPVVYTAFAPIFQSVMAHRQPQIVPNAQMAMSRNGRLEERFFTFAFLPIVDRDGNCLGIYESAREVTKERLSERRLSTLLEISICAGRIRDKKVYWTHLLDAIAGNKEDIGFAMLYSLEYASEAPTRVLKRDFRQMCTLEGSFGLPHGFAGALPQIDLAADTSGYALGMKHALEANAPVIFKVDEHSWLPSVLDGLTCRGYAASCQGVVICPIRPAGGTDCVAFVIIGLSARIVLDADFKQFVEILDRHMAASLASVLLFDEELSHERQKVKDATLIHAKLQERLQRKDQQLLSVEAKFERLTDRMPVAVCTTNIHGEITYANQAFYTTTGHSGTDVSPESWMAIVHEDDRDFVMSKFKEVWTTERVQFECKLNKVWTKRVEAENVSTSTWILASAFLDRSLEGGSDTLVSIMTDISDQKWAERLQYRRMLEALEAKKQQEDFIDTVSHEIRNPLSAILQSVDEIADYLNLDDALRSRANEQLHGSLDAIKTITYCCQHQKRIVDDILSLSKIKSQMLTVSRERTDVANLIQEVIMMFSTELKASNITITTTLGEGVENGAFSELMVDPKRVSQILINLLSNAIKFTRASRVRRIEIECDIDSSRPSAETYGIKYMDSQMDESTNERASNAAGSEHIYLHFIMRDTGIGMSDAQKNLLFTRFAQATPRTHVHYGGSGLGLFICKQLCELQGGAIGLKMTEDTRTTLAFFVKASKPQHTLQVRNGNPTGANDGTAANPPILINNDSPSRPRPAPTAFYAAINPEDITILVVEDNVVNQRVMMRQLKRQGFHVYKADNGAEALEFLETTSRWKGGHGRIELSLILLDIEMPVMDGITCISRIRRLEANGTLLARVPVISVSANVRDVQVAHAKSAGMDDSISKPFRINEVVLKIHALLER